MNPKLFFRTPNPLKIILGMAVLLLSSMAAEPLLSKEITWSQDKRYRDNGDQTITDTKTGLMWMKFDAYQHTGHWMNWNEALWYVKELNSIAFATYSDWQVPTRKELQTLYEADKLNGAQAGREMKIHIDPIFAKNGSGSLWASETNGNYNAFGVILNDGQQFSAHKSSRSRKSIRAVRYPQSK